MELLVPVDAATVVLDCATVIIITLTIEKPGVRERAYNNLNTYEIVFTPLTAFRPGRWMFQQCNVTFLPLFKPRSFISPSKLPSKAMVVQALLP